ncbi:hypothetical protein RSJ21_15030 [Clostridium botulinum]|nr:hypothetical protein [Clostridium botulinum]AUM88824.1 hypothetical protein RSJ15_14350 [Clostridium botulinum]AUN11844.1 hypothetical protein RSJ6_15575 [Clostridium botulinum]AUN22787.1 hypothetical protein RSJ22_15615 [Clostridium botulinum]AUN26497.1 hypothetical protein RSJ21_15030 [Clostridium botulinum]AWB31422.1 hypothetical protein DBN47_14520 [Clostridium botulinum]
MSYRNETCSIGSSKDTIKELDRNDIVTVDKDLAEFIGIRLESTPRKKQ